MSHTKVILRQDRFGLREKPEVRYQLRDRPSGGGVARRSVFWFGLCVLAATLLFVTRGGTRVHATWNEGVRWVHSRVSEFRKSPLPLVGGAGGSDESQFQLHGIVYSSINPIAVVNGTAVGSGERASVSVRGGKEYIQCVDIRPEAVKIETSQGSGVTLHLP